jgi:hypothetical protein
MLLLPTVVLGLAGFLWIFQLGVGQLQLSQAAFLAARSYSIQGNFVQPESIQIEIQIADQMVCAHATKNLLIELREKACFLIQGA